jgi:hypothetical protein
VSHLWAAQDAAVKVDGVGFDGSGFVALGHAASLTFILRGCVAGAYALRIRCGPRLPMRPDARG